MKLKMKMVRRLGAVLLAVLFLVQTVLGLLPVRTVNAAVNSIDVWDESEVMDYGYRFNVKFQPGITRAVSFGCDNKDKEAFTNHGRSERNADTKRMTDDYVPESAGIRYYNVGRDGAGNIVDFKLTVVSVKNPEPRYDMQTVIAKDNAENGNGTVSTTYDWENNIGQPLVGFSLESIGIFIYCVDSAKVHLQFLKHDTEEPLPISGHGTVRDLDAGQGVIIEEDSCLDKAYILRGNTSLEVNGTEVIARSSSLEPDNKEGWLNLLYSSDSIYFSFTHFTQLARWDKSRADGIAKYGSQEQWAEYMRNKYTDANGNSYCSNFDGGKFMRGHAYFDFTSYCFGGIEMKKAPEKRVGTAGCSWEDAVAAEKGQPFGIKDCEEFQYMIQTEVTPNQLNSFMVQDTLENCLAIDDVSKVIVKNEAGQYVTEQFDIRIEGQTVTCSAKQEYLVQEEFTDNKIYTFSLLVHRKQDAQIGPYLDTDGYSILVPNSAVMSYQRTNGTGDSLTSDTVWVRGIIPPELVVEKTSSKYEWNVGDTVDYAVTVRQVKPDVKAVNVTVEDSLPSCLQLQEGQYRVEGAAGCSISAAGTNGWRVQCPALGYGESFTVIYKCTVLESANGQEAVNTVNVTAENLIDPSTGEQEYVKNLAEVWTNSPQLEIDKTADKYEWCVGDRVTYRIVVKNTVPGTVAKNVRISDIGLPQGLILTEGVQNIEILDVIKQVDYPVPDQKTGMAYEQRPVESFVEADGQGFSFYCGYLPYSYPVTILCHCTATEDANAHESVNVALVQAENAPESSDDAEAFVNTGELWIEKTADHYEWQVGEQVEYTVTVENRKEGTIARNVTIWDNAMPVGLSLASPDSVSISGIPERIIQPVAGTPDIPNSVNPEFYQETAEKMVSYEFIPDGTGWRMNISDLPAYTPVTIHFFCTVTEPVNGTESINMAGVQAENAPQTTDDAEAYINTAVLSLEKGFDNLYLAAGDGREAHEFRVGEQIYYRVIVDNLQKGSIARNVVISDVSLPQGLALDGGEDAVQIYGIPQTIQNPVAGTDDAGNLLNPENYNQVEEKPVITQFIRQGTGWILSVSDIPYHTPVTVVFRCTVQESVNGMEVVNTANAYADNAAPVKGTSKVWINSPVIRVEKSSDKPSYKYGDIITYTVVMTQEQTGCAARDVVLEDGIETPGVKLLKDSIVLLDEKGNLIEGSIEANDDNTFRVSTGRNLVKDEEYLIYDSEQGGAVEQVMMNPLNCRDEEKMTVEYCAAVIDEKLAGQTVHNIAIANSKENIHSSGEAVVEIHSPILDIMKESDKAQYCQGETGYYKLTVRQLREDVKAENIVVEDCISGQGAVLQSDSILLKKNGQIERPVEIQTGENSFRILTGLALTDADKMEICYKVLFKEASQEETVVTNTAKAMGDHTPETGVDHQVVLSSKIPEASPTPVPTATPQPTVTPTPTVTPRPTVTPTPTVTPRPTAVPTAVPTPTAAPKPTETPRPTCTPRPTTGACPGLTQIPPGTSGNNLSGGTNGGSTTGGKLSGGSTSGGSSTMSSGGSGSYYSNGYSGYQGGSVAGSSKTGDARPFEAMAKAAGLGLILLGLGVWMYRKVRKTEGK